ncbi:STAS domain-containing protein [Lentzea sp. BCCO 10_0061]|uniref:Anti-sigma factor antagonist n=1 Tax=Lentzea sokolovensis TaxID=3095429 RepID=A0ABU4UMA4_9PSEU|nr:STAS domain-containing protein [Lentzea sp. BCCO 10_0061]MDX8140621.1 STAS domain-containing protein [Lentzea sp. BCCO 10_0061]
MDEALLKVESERLPNAVVLRAEGEVDSYTADLLRAKLSEAFGVGLPVVLDLSHVEFFASIGLSALVEFHQRGEDSGIPLRLVSPRGSVLRALKATTLNETLDLYLDLDAALHG